MPWRSQSEPTLVEKIVAGLSYITPFGIAGLLYMLFARNRSQSKLFLFHFYQSVILWVVVTLFQLAMQPISRIVLGILGVVSQQIASGAAWGVGSFMSLLEFGFYLLLAYGAVMAFLGKFAEVPFISNIVRQNMRV